MSDPIQITPVHHPRLPLLASVDGRVIREDGSEVPTREDKDGYLICDPWYGLTLRVGRFVLECFEGFDDREADHRDRNKKNNRRENLWYRTVAQNRANVGVKKSSKTGVKNVRAMKGRFCAYFVLNGKYKSLGCYGTLAEAELVASVKHLQLWGTP